MARPILLAVDDDVSVLEAVVQDLRRQYGAEYRVMRAASGQAALDTLTQVKARQEPVALLLSDQRMPGMTGVEFLERAREQYPDARRVLLTAYADTEAAIRAINTARIHYYLNKPWDPPEEKLYPVLTDLLEDWKARTFAGRPVRGRFFACRSQSGCPGGARWTEYSCDAGVLRHGSDRRGSRGIGSRCLWCQRRPPNSGDRTRSAWRTGRLYLAHRELSGLSVWDHGY
jgi:CheY-like chemotaxis protein